MSSWVKPLDRRTAVRLGLKMALIAALILAGGQWFTGRYIVGIDAQVERSLPGKRVFIIDTANLRAPERQQLVGFHAQGMNPWFEDGTKMIKLVMGVPGDSVRVRAEGVYINDFPVLAGSALAEPLGLTAEQVNQDYVLAAGEYFVGGLHEKSYDSRYFGPVRTRQFIGRGYALF